MCCTDRDLPADMKAQTSASNSLAYPNGAIIGLTSFLLRTRLRRMLHVIST